MKSDLAHVGSKASDLVAEGAEWVWHDASCTASEAWYRLQYSTITTDVLGMLFRDISAGSFTMGSPVSEVGRNSDELQHTVTLSNDFELQAWEVTEGQFEALLGYNPSYLQWGATYPVEQVTWHEAAAFANALSTVVGYAECYTCSGSGSTVSCTAPADPYACEGYRLPTEAEWEYASRAGTTGAFWTPNGGGNLFSGDEYSCDPSTLLDDGTALIGVSWHCAASSAYSAPSLNDWDLRYMYGNVSEWVNDWYDAYSSGAVTDPAGPATGSYKILRGGHYSAYPKDVRSAVRQYLDPASVDPYAGIRLARTK